MASVSAKKVKKKFHACVPLSMVSTRPVFACHVAITADSGSVLINNAH
jgi:hypothetical protein